MVLESDFMKRSVSLETLKLLFFLAYFPILTIERIISLCIMLFSEHTSYTSLDYYMMGIIMLSTAAYVFLIVGFRSILFRRCGKRRSIEVLSSRKSYRTLSAATGILLAGGMLDTKGSVRPVQLAAYSCVIIAMVLHCIQNINKDGGADRKWLSFAYTASFALSIPFVYNTQIEHAKLFIPIEIVVNLGLIILFTIMLIDYFSGNCESSFSLLPFLVAVFGDALVISMRWYEEISIVTLLAVCIVTVLWFTGSILGANPDKIKK